MSYMLLRNSHETIPAVAEESPHPEQIGSLKEVFGYTALFMGALCVYAGAKYGTIDPLAALAALTRDTM